MRRLKIKPVLLLSGLILYSIGFNACKDNSDDANNTNTLTQQDKGFATSAAASNLAEIQFGRLASQKASLDSVKIFAQTMVTEHTLAQSSLDSISKSLNLTMSDSMDVAHRTLFTRLQALTGAGFDSVYIHNQVLDHEASRTLMQNQISNGKDTRLVNYAKKNLPVVNRHLAEATRIRAHFNNNQTGQPGY
jgi:putative membrane protein